MLALWRGIGENKDDKPPEHRHPCAAWYINGPARLCRSVAHQSWFQNGVTVAILFAAGLAGIETEPKYASSPVVEYFNMAISIIFTIEVVVKLIAEEFKPWRFFKSGWNVFDVVIVAFAWLPTDQGDPEEGEEASASPIKIIRRPTPH